MQTSTIPALPTTNHTKQSLSPSTSNQVRLPSTDSRNRLLAGAESRQEKSLPGCRGSSGQRCKLLSNKEVRVSCDVIKVLVWFFWQPGLIKFLWPACWFKIFKTHVLEVKGERFLKNNWNLSITAFINFNRCNSFF